MENQNTSGSVFKDTGLPTQTKRKTAQKTVEQLIEDRAAMDDWFNSIEKIRQQESGVVTKNSG